MTSQNENNTYEENLNNFCKHLKNKPFQKYEIAEEDYDKRENTVRKFRKTLAEKKCEDEEKKDCLKDKDEIGSVVNGLNYYEKNVENCSNYSEFGSVTNYKSVYTSSQVDDEGKNNAFNSDEDEI